jgi:hypothetical protein
VGVKHQLNIEYVPILSIQQHPRNANNGDEDAIADSIRVNGLYDALKVQRSTGYIVAGNHRWAELVRRKWVEVPVIWLDVDDAEALRILAADNRINRMGHDDESQLADNLQQLFETDTGLAGTGYGAREYQYLLELVEEPLTAEDFEVDTPVDNGVDNELDNSGGGLPKSLVLALFPTVDEDGSCHEITITKPGMGRFSLQDYLDIIRALGLPRMDRVELAAFGVLDWKRR